MTTASVFLDSVRNLRNTHCAVLTVGFGILVNLPCAISTASYFQCLQASEPKALENDDDDDDDDNDDNDCNNKPDGDDDDKLDCVDDAAGFEMDDSGSFSLCMKYFPSGLHRFVIESEPLDMMISSVPTNFRLVMLSVWAEKLQLGTLGVV